MLTLFTDGCFNKDGCGWSVINPVDKVIHNGRLTNGTSQRAELTAVIKAVELYGANITIITDSLYSINCFTRWYESWLDTDWKNNSVKNRDLIEYGLRLGINNVTFQHIRGHTGNYYNEMADYYCKTYLLRVSDTGWTQVLN
jgi:ribonuclease HI